MSRAEQARRDLPAEELPVHSASARTHVMAAGTAGLVAGVIVGLVWRPGYGAIAGWEVACAVYLVWVWTTIWRMDAERTATLAVVEDPTRATADLLLLSAAVASLVAVGLVLASAANAHGFAQDSRIALGLASVVLSWGVVHTVHTLRYARIYYTGVDGGVNFKQDEPPTYSDFAYLAFTVGMTFQVSDTDLEINEMRRTVMRHALLSFLFATGIVATSVNLVASITTK
jgi:uncharacterized membrane protein